MTGACLFLVNFHHVRERNPDRFPGFHHRTPLQVRAQLEQIAREFELISPSEAERVLSGTDDPGRRLAMITFDDGLLDHYEVVAPLLESLGLRALFCVNTRPWQDGRLLSVHRAHVLSAAFSYPELADDIVRAARTCGVTSRYDDVPVDRAVAQYRYDSREVAVVKFYLNAVVPQGRRDAVLRDVFEARIGDDRECARMHYMTPGMVGELAARGHTIGLHSHEHLFLASADAENRRRDLAINRELITAHAGPPSWISYPYGSPASYDAAVISDARDIGCRFGMTMTRGVNLWPFAADVMTLRRCDTNDVPGGKTPKSWQELLT